MKTKIKPKYNIVQNVIWMVKIAWKAKKQVLLICILTALMEVLYSLAQLYIAPQILHQVEQRSSLGSLLTTILLFTAALFAISGIKQYLIENAMFSRVDVRTAIINMIAIKSNTSSFPNTLNGDFIKLREKAHDACNSNGAAAEYIWTGLTNLLKNTGGFLVYLTILSHLNTTLLLVVIATCFAGFLVSRYTNNWIYQHREDENIYYVKKMYIRDKSESVVLAKDIRIFGLQNWLNDLLDSVHNTYLIYHL